MMAKHIVINFPEIGEGVAEGEIIEWLKKEGDMLVRDEPVVIVMTDKATVELPTPYPGKLVKQYFQPGQMAIRDKPLYEIELLENHEEIIQEPLPQEPQHQKDHIKEIPPPIQKESQFRGRSESQGKATAIPKVRHLAKQLEIDLEVMAGTGKEGRVTMADLCRRQKSTLPSTDSLKFPDDEVIPVIGIKKLMAVKMAESKMRIPHFSYFESVDVARLVQLKVQVKERAREEGLHLTYMPFIIKALSLCINEFPMINSSYDQESSQLHIHRQHNIGIAMSTSLGLIVPVLKGVQGLAISQLAHAYEELVEKARTNKLKSSDMKEGTVTLSNYGTGGHGLWATPIINYSEVAILAIAKIQEQPVVKNGVITIAEMMNLSWSFDHRVIDGDLAMHISDRFCKLLRDPAPLL